MTKKTYDAEILSQSDSLEEWDSFVDDSPQGCIFCRSWWLEAVSPKGFDILVLRKGDRIVAGMPMIRCKFLGLKAIYMPPYAQVLGVLLAPQGSPYYEKRLSNEMKVLTEFIKAIPTVDYFNAKFHYSFTNWLPFYWAGYKQTTLYTYIIPDLTNLDKVFSAFSYSKKRNIAKAEKIVSVYEDLPAPDFYANHVLTLGKQGKQISYSFDRFKKMYDAAYKKMSGKTWYALDNEKNIHAAIFVIFDNKSAYYLISTIDPDFRNSGATTLLIKNAITYVSQYTKRFDFEGSMIPGVENSFRNFGAIQTPYFNITKASLLGRAVVSLRFQVNKLIKTLRPHR